MIIRFFFHSVAFKGYTQLPPAIVLPYSIPKFLHPLRNIQAKVDFNWDECTDLKKKAGGEKAEADLETVPFPLDNFECT